MTFIVRDDGFHNDDLKDIDFLSISQLDSIDAIYNTFFVELDVNECIAELVKFFPYISTIRIRFASFENGRGFSLAYRLRQQGYRGRLQAEGYLIADQYLLARRSGFDEVAISDALAARQPVEQWPLGNTEQKPNYLTQLKK